MADYVAARIAVMYRGEFVKLAPRESLFAMPTHPYTRAVLRAVPVADLAKPLDFDAIADAGGVQSWEVPFADGDAPTQLFEVAKGHFVRAVEHPG